MDTKFAALVTEYTVAATDVANLSADAAYSPRNKLAEEQVSAETLGMALAAHTSLLYSLTFSVLF